MAKIILARHGSESHNGINKFGVQQMTDLADRLIPILGDDSLLIFCSIALRAVTSAEVIAAKLGVSVEEVMGLGSYRGDPYEIKALIPLLMTLSSRSEFILCLTHMPAIVDVFLYVSGQDWEMTVDTPPIQGQAMLLDTERKTYSII